RRHTRCLSDWSSDVCSSDLTDTMGRKIQFNYDNNYRLTSISVPGFGGTSQNPVTQTIVQFDYQTVTTSGTFSGLTVECGPGSSKIGRAACRERVKIEVVGV